DGYWAAASQCARAPRARYDRSPAGIVCWLCPRVQRAGDPSRLGHQPAASSRPALSDGRRCASACPTTPTRFAHQIGVIRRGGREKRSMPDDRIDPVAGTLPVLERGTPCGLVRYLAGSELELKLFDLVRIGDQELLDPD